MNKVVSKIINCIFLFIFVCTNFLVPSVAKAQTLGDLKSELAAKQAELQANQNKKAQTQAQINQTNSEITTIRNTINQLYTEMANLDKEIEKLNKDIAQKEKEMKQIINYTQVSNGEEAYLEYAFGAADFTDFIYRMAIAEQLTEYNEKLIKEFNQAIEDSRKKQEDMRKKQANMAEQQALLQTKLASLGQELDSISDTGVTIEDSIDYQKEIIALYESKGCKDNENILTCGRKVLPQGTAFYRPTEIGRISSEWGYRDLLGRSWHEGIDTAVDVGTTVYAAGNGMVAMTVRYNCGGNMVVIHHNINNRNYTTVYAHLSRINVSKGQTVNRNTIVGYSGGSAGGYDRCTTGPHFHLTVATGWYGVDYYDWLNELNVKYSINPRSVINYPGYWVPWYDRISEY